MIQFTERGFRIYLNHVHVDSLHNSRKRGASLLGIVEAKAYTLQLNIRT